MYHDGEGNIWVAQSDGLVQLKPKLIKAFDKTISAVYTIIEDQEGKVWATQNLEKLFQLQGGHFQQMNDNVGVNELIYSLFISSDSLFWMGTKNGVFRWDRKRPAVLFNNAMLSDSLPLMQGIKTIQEDDDGNLWFGGNFGLHQLDKRGNWHHFGRADKKKYLVVRIIHFSQDGILWVGTNGDGLQYLKDGKSLLKELIIDGDVGNVWGVIVV